MLNPLHLRTLATVLQTGSFAVAARQLRYTPSAVSQQIAALERATRLPPFEREARRIRDEGGAGRADPAAAGRRPRRRPGLPLHRVPARQPRALTVAPLLREDLVLMLPADHPLAAAEEVPLEQLADAVWVTTRQGTEGATCLQRMCADAGFEPRITYRSNDYDVIRGFVRSGPGIALVPVLGHGPDPGVVTLRPAGVRGHRYVGVLTREGIRNPAVEGVTAALTASARAPHEPERGLVHEPPAPGGRRTSSGPLRPVPTRGQQRTAS